MTEKRRRFSAQFRAEAVQLVVQSDRTVTEVARDLGVERKTLNKWVSEFRRAQVGAQGGAREPAGPVERVRVEEMEAEIRRLRMENEFLKKSRGLLRPDLSVAARCGLIEAEKDNYPIVFMCDLLALPRSSYYAWRHRAETVAGARRRVLGSQIRQVFDRSRQTYGCRRVAAQLNRDGYACSVGLVAALMRGLGLRAVQPRGYRRTTLPGDHPVNSPDLLERAFAPDSCAPGERLVGDITYLRTGQGWLYLATVIDLATRMVVGWQLADHTRTSLVVDALQMALDAHRVAPGAIFHSDRGTQYTSSQYVQYCRTHAVRTSLGRTGVCWDNAPAETFFAALKNDLYHRHTWPTQAAARTAVAEYIEVFYNRQRLHSTLGYRTPHEALTNHQTPTAA
ncbi:IS3 family transposase [Kribbella jiaozuonensis]|uniref:IS3 family transposase n=1 Tax=Kribbella jiaozuonensis TaxID=2575441 RepID=A0A4U3LAX2_9ACTN|nr:IS3 family transposase [Kribbella jiaozuonensis]TKK72518.1 IS3 family transposase [Kribbella jiaozuonensis]